MLNLINLNDYKLLNKSLSIGSLLARMTLELKNYVYKVSLGLSAEHTKLQLPENIRRHRS